VTVKLHQATVHIVAKGGQDEPVNNLQDILSAGAAPSLIVLPGYVGKPHVPWRSDEVDDESDALI
jgi:hypothetical protein